MIEKQDAAGCPEPRLLFELANRMLEDSAEVASLGRHLESCAACKDKVAGYAGAIAPLPDPPAGSLQKIFDRIDREGIEEQLRRRRRWPLPFALLLAVVVAALVVVFTSRGPDSPVEVPPTKRQRDDGLPPPIVAGEDGVAPPSSPR